MFTDTTSLCRCWSCHAPARSLTYTSHAAWNIRWLGVTLWCRRQDAGCSVRRTAAARHTWHRKCCAALRTTRCCRTRGVLASSSSSASLGSCHSTTPTYRACSTYSSRWPDKPREGYQVLHSACLSVCPLAYLKIHNPHVPTSVHVSCGRGSILIWRQCNTVCASGFLDDVTFFR